MAKMTNMADLSFYKVILYGKICLVFKYEHEPLDEPPEEEEPLDGLIATPLSHYAHATTGTPIWASGRVVLLRNNPRLSLSNPTVGGPS